MVKVNKAPRISVNKLGEYVVSRANRQARILRDQKYPAEYITAFYKDAQDAIARFLADGMQNASVLERTIQRLDQSPADTVFKVRQINSNIEAVSAFMDMVDDIDFHGGTPHLGHAQPEKLKIRNVEVSVRPEVLLTGRNNKGQPIVGGIKLHFPATSPLSEEPCAYISATMQRFCADCLQDLGEPFHRYCFVIDIASRQVYKGAQSVRRRMNDVEAACEQIFNLWPTIKPAD